MTTNGSASLPVEEDNEISQIIMRIYDKTLMQRTGLKAMYNGKVITGCSECGDNIKQKGLIAIAPIHRCRLRIGTDGQNEIIWDPYNIPTDCPYALIEEQK